jgi:hypothetical protein
MTIDRIWSSLSHTYDTNMQRRRHKRNHAENRRHKRNHAHLDSAFWTGRRLKPMETGGTSSQEECTRDPRNANCMHATIYGDEAEAGGG